ncbi:MAG: photosynthetic complex assembly protein PuhC [Pseudomonadota bacterium]|nr:photosynthetic complex assembly protein PuhC [Pseudomonadota bacterium]
MKKRREMAPEIFPGLFIKILGGSLLVVLIAVFYYRFTDKPLVGVAPDSAIKLEKTLQFVSNGRLDISIFDSEGVILANSKNNNQGFISVVYSAIQRERIKKRVKGNDFLRLVLQENDRLVLIDDATNMRIHLNSFGEKNMTVFSVLLN